MDNTETKNEFVDPLTDIPVAKLVMHFGSLIAYVLLNKCDLVDMYKLLDKQLYLLADHKSAL
jgi:hypothetical protein